MKSKLVKFILFTFVLGIASCSSSQKSNKKQNLHSGDNSRTSLDWDGRYQGILPCADCEGIKTQLTLKDDLTYLLESKYLGSSDDIVKVEGTFSWNEKGNTITLDNSNNQQYFVGENILFHLDKNSQRIKGDLADKYILHKEKAELAGKYWKLVRLNGKDVNSQAREPHIKFETESSRASGNGGCNQFSCSFESPGPNRIIFGNVMSTKMACIGDSVEDLFFQVMEKTTIYSLSAGELKMKDEYETTLAVFESDYFK